MNYIKSEDIITYVRQKPNGIAGMSEELAAMVNHFAELLIMECANHIVEKNDCCGDEILVAEKLAKHFGVDWKYDEQTN